jgi:hypothetical protein
MADTAALVTTYATLQAAIVAELNRSDLTAAVKRFIRSAERRFQRDHRIRKAQDREFLVDADNAALPTDYQSLGELYHNGPTFYGKLDVVQPSELSRLKQTRGATSGAPRNCSIIAGRLRFDPVPDQSYALRMWYWLKIDLLSDVNTVNWLLQDHDDLYFYGALLQSAPYLKGDARIPVWDKMYNERAEELHAATERAQYPGSLSRTAKPLR